MARANSFRFSTKYEDDETDLLYYGYRYYNPSTGRWLNPDPSGEGGGLNIYVFANNSPVGAVDLLGLHVYTVDVTAKSWIVRPVTGGWVTRMDPGNYPNLLFAVKLLELLTSDNVVDDSINGQYRFLSQKTISVECCGSTLKSFHFSSLFTAVVKRGQPIERIPVKCRGFFSRTF